MLLDNFKFTPYSFSKLSNYLSCAKKFKYAYIDKAPKSETDKTALLKGGAIHSILEHYPNHSPHKLASQYSNIADKFIESDLGKKYLSVAKVAEASFGLDMDFKPVDYSDKSAVLRGFIDHICVIDNILHICDYKTGKEKSEIYQDYDQLKLYAVYFFQRYENIDKIIISYIYVEHENSENKMTLEREYLDSYINTFKEYISNIEKDDVFIKNETKLCDWCEYKEHCLKDTSI